MSKSLIIVESPAKAKTIGQFLGRSCIVKASMGHVRDLPKSQFGIDVEKGFAPKYITIRGKGEVLSELKKQQKKVDKVYLAADPDREGEAICWHLAQYLNLENNLCRIEFNEITEKAVKKAFENPRTIDMNRVYAQQARRILDRIVGYKLSPLLWDKVKKGLSAGRVQTVTMRLICEREREIQAFIPEEYWKIFATLTPGTKKNSFDAELIQRQGKRIKLSTKEQVDTILNAIKGKEFVVNKITRKEKKRNPVPPFITSSMQQEAMRKLGFGTRKTMRIAQQLYEGLSLGEKGSVGLITYMRTDSTRVAKEAQLAAREYISKTFGKGFVPPYMPVYKTKESAQDAHEAIRPTDAVRTPASVKAFLSNDQYKLYKLIWDRFIASQMASAIIDTTSIDITAGDCVFRATGSVVKFSGFMAIYIEDTDEENKEKENILPELHEKQILELMKITPSQHFTKPPARYTEATLVRALEEKGIGRPSTYATIIETIMKRGYVVTEDKHLVPSELGLIVTDLLVKHFPDVFNIEFTALMEARLDKIVATQEDWVKVLKDFYAPFIKTLDKANTEMEKVKLEDEVSGEICSKCGRNMVIKYGRFGKFLACSGFPECRNTQAIVTKIDAKCPKCGADIVERRTKKGRKFYGCSKYPECDFVAWNKPSKESCPKCGSFLIITKRKNKKIVKCANNNCNYTS